MAGVCEAMRDTRVHNSTFRVPVRQVATCCVMSDPRLTFIFVVRERQPPKHTTLRDDEPQRHILGAGHPAGSTHPDG